MITKSDIERLERKLFDVLEKKADGVDESGLTAAELTAGFKYVREKDVELNPEDIADDHTVNQMLADDEELPFKLQAVK